MAEKHTKVKKTGAEAIAISVIIKARSPHRVQEEDPSPGEFRQLRDNTVNFRPSELTLFFF